MHRQGARKLSYAEVRDRVERLASWLARQGLGRVRERRELEHWQSGQDPSRSSLQLSEYVEVMLACFQRPSVQRQLPVHGSRARVAASHTRVSAPHARNVRRAGERVVCAAAELRLLIRVAPDESARTAPLRWTTRPHSRRVIRPAHHEEHAGHLCAFTDSDGRPKACCGGRPTSTPRRSEAPSSRVSTLSLLQLAAASVMPLAAHAWCGALSLATRCSSDTVVLSAEVRRLIPNMLDTIVRERSRSFR